MDLRLVFGDDLHGYTQKLAGLDPRLVKGAHRGVGSDGAESTRTGHCTGPSALASAKKT